MAFVTAMNTETDTKIGVNGADVYTEKGVGDYRVSLYTMLNRNLSYDYILNSLKNGLSTNDLDIEKDFFVMLFQTRDIRGGKGEKQLFYHFFKALYEYRPKEYIKMISLIPEYGCWRDMWKLLSAVGDDVDAEILRYVSNEFKKCQAYMDSGEVNKMSLLAKWLPRENSKTFKGAALKIAAALFPEASTDKKRLTLYRKSVAAMNKALKTVEINMCGGEWSTIVPSAVPGRCLKNNKRAFLNLNLKKDVPRYPENEDRKQCKENFQKFIEDMKKGNVKAKGANVVMPHELVANTLSYSTSDDEHEIIQGQWNSIRESVLEKGGLRSSVPMCDFSGSMNGTPKLVSLALGVLISEINHPSFRDHILTFDSTPSWHSFIGKTSLKDKLNSIGGSLGQGLSTDFYKACQSILTKMVENKVPVGEEPEDLIVLTDMGWDSASRGDSCYMRKSNDRKWCTQIETIRREFKEAGEQVWGEGNGWKPPRIVVWNLSADYNDFQATAEDDGVIVISGWSSAGFKSIQNGIKVTTPHDSLRIVLDDPRYDLVRDAWATSKCVGVGVEMA